MQSSSERATFPLLFWLRLPRSSKTYVFITIKPIQNHLGIVLFEDLKEQTKNTPIFLLNSKK